MVMAIPMGWPILIGLVAGCAVGIVFMAAMAMAVRQTSREDDEDQMAALAEWRKLHWKDGE